MLFEKHAGTLVSSPKYSGLPSVLKIDLIDSYENPNFWYFSQFETDAVDFNVQIPKFWNLLQNKAKKMKS